VSLFRLLKLFLFVKYAIIKNCDIEYDGKILAKDDPLLTSFLRGCELKYEFKVIINVEIPASHKNKCPICGEKCPGYDHGSNKPRRWRTLDFGPFKCYLSANIPRIMCKEHSVITCAVPWASHGSRFTRAFEFQLAHLAMYQTKTDVCNYLRISWDTIGYVMDRVWTELKNKLPDPKDKLVRIGIDETSRRKGHKYITVVVNHDTGELIWVNDGYGKEVLSKFFESLTEKQRLNIKLVSADGARWIDDCILQYCPNAQKCLDPFHTVSWATAALDEVRRQMRQELLKSKDKKITGSKFIKGIRYTLLKNPENLTMGQMEMLDALAKFNPRLYRAYMLKESLRCLLKYEDIKELKSKLQSWIIWAKRCRIEPFKDLGSRIAKHFDNIIAAAENRLSNARIEAVNNKIKVTNRMGYGYSNMKNFFAMIMMRCSEITIPLVGRLYDGQIFV
jgi:transposase